MVAELDSLFIQTKPQKALTRLIAHGLLQGRPVTTKHRWLNRIILTQFSIVKRIPQLNKVKSPIFIIGTGRSGTTILGKILSIHDDILYLNEAKALWYSTFPEDDVIGSYTLSQGKYFFDEEAATANIIEAAHRLYGYALAISGTKRILDKYPEMIFRIRFLKAIFPDARFLFLIRNGWDTVQSIRMWSKKQGVQINRAMHDWWGIDRRKWKILVRDIVTKHPALSPSISEIAGFTRHEDMAAVEWVVTMHEGLYWINHAPDLILPIRFEQLVGEPEKALRKILGFCKLDCDQILFDYAADVMRPPQPKLPCKLHTKIEPVFLEMMEALNYPI